MSKRRLLSLSLSLLIASCGGKLTVDSHDPGYRESSGGAEASGGSTPASGAHNERGGAQGSSAGSPANAAGTGLEPIAGTSAGTTTAGTSANGGSGGDDATVGGWSSAAGEGGDAGSFDCDLADVRGDCHRVTCDEAGHGTRTVDQTDLPSFENPCLAGTCNAQGKPGVEPRDIRVSCEDDSGGVACNGAGKCVECLISQDCGPGRYCTKAQECGPDPCTDIDCGGACPVCADGKKCLADSDCQSGACDSLTLTCITDHCKDHHQNSSESDADCGGGVCVGCKLGQSCGLNLECASNACDGVLATCVAYQCIDHHQDGDESDVDCGGGTCAGCPNYKKCKSNFDCADGTCSLTVPHLCQ